MRNNTNKDVMSHHGVEMPDQLNNNKVNADKAGGNDGKVTLDKKLKDEVINLLQQHLEALNSEREKLLKSKKQTKNQEKIGLKNTKISYLTSLIKEIKNIEIAGIETVEFKLLSKLLRLLGKDKDNNKAAFSHGFFMSSRTECVVKKAYNIVFLAMRRSIANEKQPSSRANLTEENLLRLG